MTKKDIRVLGDNDKCKNCGSEIKFDPKTQKLNCPSCGALNEFEKSLEIVSHLVEKRPDIKQHKEWLKSSKFLQCDNCGAKIALGRYDLTTNCPYCGSDFISQIGDLPGASPDAIIPFKFSPQVAGEHFSRYVKKKFFVPRSFKKNLPSNKIRGVYIPAFAFDANTKSTYDGKLVKSDGDDVDYFSIDGTNEQVHKNVLVEASSKISDFDLNNILPFDLNGAYKYNANFIKGFSVEHYHEVMTHCINIAHNKIDKEIEENILKQYNYSRVHRLDVNTTYSNEKYTYYLLPIYNLEYTYNNEKYITHMNGQTGKIGGGLPISKWKIGLLVGLGILLFGFVAFEIYKFVTGM